MCQRANNFNPRSPCGERPTAVSASLSTSAEFQSALPLRGATLLLLRCSRCRHISIRAPRAGSDAYQRADDDRHARFQSALPLRGATCPKTRKQLIAGHFNPRSPCGERRVPGYSKIPKDYHFNPRSPCGERHASYEQNVGGIQFQSALPLRGATRTAAPSRPRWPNFNPRSPCGERPGDTVNGAV